MNKFLIGSAGIAAFAAGAVTMGVHPWIVIFVAGFGVFLYFLTVNELENPRSRTHTSSGAADMPAVMGSFHSFDCGGGGGGGGGGDCS
jgi:hypothetical protein